MAKYRFTVSARNENIIIEADDFDDQRGCLDFYNIIKDGNGGEKHDTVGIIYKSKDEYVVLRIEPILNTQ